MPRYLSLHSLACLTRQGAEQLAARVKASQVFSAQRVLVNMTEGKMMVEYQAADRETIERWLAQEKFHHDWLLRLEWEFKDGKLETVG